MKNQQSPQNRDSYIEEILKAISTQSALLAGFGFTGLTAISYDSKTPQFLVGAFGTCISISISLEILSLFISGVLIFVAKLVSIEDKFDREFSIAWFSYLGGLATFLISIILLAWIKIQPAAIPITIIVVVTAVIIVNIFYKIGTSPHTR